MAVSTAGALRGGYSSGFSGKDYDTGIHESSPEAPNLS